MLEIASKDNKSVKDYVKLSTSKSYRDERSLFTIEGVKLIIEAYNNGVSFEEIFVTDSCYKKHVSELEKLVQAAKCRIVTNELSSKLSLQNSPQGIYAICNKLDKIITADKIYHSGRYIFLVDLQDAGNIGTIIRTADAMGIDGVILTDKTCDIYNPKVIRGSMGSVFRMPFLVIDNPSVFLGKLRENGVKTYASVIDVNATSVTDINFESPCALLIGNEGNGLSEEVISHCYQNITIHMSGNTESLNASMAAGICMWEMTK